MHIAIQVNRTYSIAFFIMQVMMVVLDSVNYLRYCAPVAGAGRIE